MTAREFATVNSRLLRHPSALVATRYHSVMAVGIYYDIPLSLKVCRLNSVLPLVASALLLPSHQDARVWLKFSLKPAE